MSKHLQIGTADGKPANLDLDALVGTRLLIQGGSGSGKSWLLRRLAEQLFGRVPVIIIDPEGEFATLREQFGYVLVGPGGETPADVRSAAMVAHKLLELHASAVCDIFEMKSADRHVWVQRFLEAMINAPKNLWQRVVVIVDEAHMFCPERGAGESAATEAMVALTTRGRKRGYVPIFATQRLGKLKKDAAAELQNVLIGRTFIDIDRDRAIDTLGVSGTKKDVEAFSHELKSLPTGRFWAFGPALTLDRQLVHVGGIQTTHPKAGSSKHAAEPPPAPEKVRALLPKLADLPQQAEQKAATEAELRKELASVRQQLQQAQKVSPSSQQASAPGKTVEVLTDADRSLLASIDEKFHNYSDLLQTAEQIVSGERLRTIVHKAIDEVTGELFQHLDRRRAEFVKLLEGKRIGAIREKVARVASTEPGRVNGFRVAAPVSARPSMPAPRRPDSSGDASLGKCERAILTVLANQPDGCEVGRLTVLAGYTYSGGFRNSLSALRQQGFIVGENTSTMRITQEGLDAIGPVDPLPSGADLGRYWLGHASLGKAERAILQVLLEKPNGMTAEQLTAATNYDYSGGFRNALSTLRTIGIISGKNTETMRANVELFG